MLFWFLVLYVPFDIWCFLSSHAGCSSSQAGHALGHHQWPHVWCACLDLNIYQNVRLHWPCLVGTCLFNDLVSENWGMEGAHFLPAVSQGIQVLQGEISEVYTCYITYVIRIPQAVNTGCLVIDKSLQIHLCGRTRHRWFPTQNFRNGPRRIGTPMRNRPCSPGSRQPESHLTKTAWRRWAT